MFALRTAASAIVALTAAAAAVPDVASAERWLMHRDRAAVTFSLKHAGFDLVEGRFNAFDAEIDFEPGAQVASSVAFTIEAASVDTNWGARDDFIRSDDMLDVEAHPRITFVSQGVRIISDTRAAVTGLVTIKGVTRTETFDVVLNRMGPSPRDPRLEVADFTVTGEIDRADYGVSAFAPAVATRMALRVDIAASPAR